jgi:diguanylate cyclase (GGDEF)-like protein
LAIARGADDYLTPPNDALDVVARVRVGVRMWALRHQLRSAAITDGLTGLYNHDYLNRVLETEMSRARRYGHCLAFIMIDVDHFKTINDAYGHLIGNTVLEQIALALKENVRDVDTVARFGGEEFAVILPEARSADALIVAERMRLAVQQTVYTRELRGHRVTASFGIADSDDPRLSTAANLVDLADRAMYQAKRLGRDCVVFASQIGEGDVAAGDECIQVDEVESLRRRVAALSVQAKEAYLQSLSSLIQALDEKDPYSARHSRNAALYAERVARAMGCSKGLIKSVRNAALLHDIGKIGIPDRILLKPESLGAIERMLMDQVPAVSTRIVDHLHILESEIQIIRHQREHYDGSGVPSHLRGDQIPIGSRILMVVDAFDAMTTDRVYRDRMSIEDAVAELVRYSGSQFDSKVVAALRSALGSERVMWEARIQETVRMLGPVGANAAE